MSKGAAIGSVARKTGVKVPTIRYYESVGLLPPPGRTTSNRRIYGDDAVRRLRFIRHARELGFDIESVRTLLALQGNPHQSCEAADAIARARLSDVERRLAGLAALKLELQRMIDGCRRGRVETCRVIEVLADHDQCVQHDHEPSRASNRPSAGRSVRTKP